MCIGFHLQYFKKRFLFFDHKMLGSECEWTHIYTGFKNPVSGHELMILRPLKICEKFFDFKN